MIQNYLKGVPFKITTTAILRIQKKKIKNI